MERDAVLEAWTGVLDDLEAALDSATNGTMDGMTDEPALGTAIDEAAAADRAHDPAPGRVAPALARYAVAGSWAPPRLESPIPDALLARARRIRERQVAVLSRLALARGEALPASAAQPVYLRNKVALTTAERMAGKAA